MIASTQNFSDACLLSYLHRIVDYELLDERTYFKLISSTTVISSRLMNIEWKLHASYGYRKCFPRVEMEYSTRRTKSTVNDDTQGRQRIVTFTAQFPKKHLMKRWLET